jgi:hypothetical protein
MDLLIPLIELLILHLPLQPNQLKKKRLKKKRKRRRKNLSFNKSLKDLMISGLHHATGI